VKPVAESLDTVGLMARTVPDVSQLAALLIGFDVPTFDRTANAPRLALCRTPAWASAELSTVAIVQEGIASLRKRGLPVAEVALPECLASALAAQATINLFESRRALAYERINFPGQISAALAQRLENGAAFTLSDYLAAHSQLARCRALLADLFKDYDVLLEPSATGEAPRGLASTGDAVFNRMWTALHVPCVSVPVLRGPAGLPLGLQVIGPMYEDRRTLEIAQRITARFA
jgi:Asp-tRNA(Asn)/Glu-tRNA(Gln) amidotransferase A subunit family amidase